jgi:hypothetical protein
MPPTCITWWHGGSVYFIYLLSLINLVGALFVFKNYKNYYLLMCVLFIVSTAFNLFGILLLFFPALNAHTLIFLYLPPTTSLIMLALLLSPFAVFATLKALTIDYDAMKREAYKNGAIDKLNSLLIFDNRRSYVARIRFKNIFSPKHRNWMKPTIVTSVLLVFGPIGALGSSMARNGNSTFNALFFLIAGSIFLWCAYFCAVSAYAQYQLIKKIEQDLRVALKPVFKTSSTPS